MKSPEEIKKLIKENEQALHSMNHSSIAATLTRMTLENLRAELNLAKAFGGVK